MLTVVMVVLMLSVGVVSVGATQNRYYNFSSGYSISGNGANDMVSVAAAQVGLTGSQLGYSEQWCADFVSDCAILVNQSDAISAAGYCPTLRQNIINSGGWYVDRYSAQAGDIVFYGNNGADHVEIVYAASGGNVSTYGGNSGSGGNLYARSVRQHATQTQSIAYIVRPNYNNIPNNFPGEEDTSWNVPIWKNANCDLNTYNDWGSQESGRRIDAGDYCYIEKVYQNGFVHVMYPTPSGDRWAYAYASGFSLEKKLPIPTGSQTISEGEYHIVSVLDESKGLDVVGASVDNGANIDLYPNLSDPNQVFDVTYLGDGSYKIINQHSGRSLDCADAGTSAGTNLQQWDYSNDPQKQWIIKETGDGESFYIVSKKSGLYIDVDNASTDNGTNIKLYTPNNSNAQKWKFITWGKNVGKTISEGEYHIASRLNSNMCLDVHAASKDNSANIDLYTNITTPEQVFVVSYLGDGYYKIINKYSGKSLDLQDAKCVSCTNIQQYDYSDDGQKQWVIKPTSDGKAFNIISKKGGLCIDVEGGAANDLQNIHGYINNGTVAQQWKFIAWQGDNATQTLSNGEYRIATAINETRALDVFGASSDDGANIEIYSNLNDPKQTFNLKYLDNGFYSITNTFSNKVLDVAGDRVINETNVIQYYSNGGANQEWMLKATDDGYYNIISHSTGMALDVFGAEDKDGANVQIYAQNQTTAQKWKLRRVLKQDMVKVVSWELVNGIMKPTVKVTVDDKILIENTDYTVSSYIENNTLYARITGIENYCDSISIEYQENAVIVGDINSDNIVDVLDAAMVQKHAVGKGSISSEQLAMADVNGDGFADILDSTEIQKYAAGIITEFKKKT